MPSPVEASSSATGSRQEPTAGEILWRGRRIEKLSASEMRPVRRELQAVFQDPYSSLNPRIRAADIVAEQAPEITQMKSWLTDAGASLDRGHAMVMDGMLSTAQMTALSAATGEAFDKLFLNGMIAHHQGAITMAKLIVDSSNPEAAALAKTIIDSQTEQIAVMEALLTK